MKQLVAIVLAALALSVEHPRASVPIFPVHLLLDGADIRLTADGACQGDLDEFVRKMPTGTVNNQEVVSFGVLAWLVVKAARNSGGCGPMPEASK